MVPEPAGDQLGNEVLLSLEFFRKEGEQIEAIFLAYLAINLLFSQVIVELVSEGLSSIEPLFWRIYHDLTDEIE